MFQEKPQSKVTTERRRSLRLKPLVSPICQSLVCEGRRRLQRRHRVRPQHPRLQADPPLLRLCSPARERSHFAVFV